MNDQTGLNTPDDEGADNALDDAREIINAAAEQLDQNNDGQIDDEELQAVEAAEAAADATMTRAKDKADEHLDDLKRLQAEYVNYRKRVERDRMVASELATARTIEALVPVLDDIAAAREHGDLEEGPFAAIAEKLEASLGRLGWETYGAVGDAFDPSIHEALLTHTTADVTVAQIQTVAQPGHRLGDRVLRPARVVVAQPE